MLHSLEVIQRLPDCFFGPSLRRQRDVSLDSGTRRNEFSFEFEEGFGDLFLDFVAHAGKAQEDAIEGAAHGGVDVEDGAGDTAAFQLVEELARPAEEEEDKDYIAQTVFD
jgi:hypothetical protein